MLDFGSYLNYHVKWTPYDHTKDMNRLNILLAKYGLKVNRHIDSPSTTTYIVDLDIDTKINAILRLEKNFSIACNDNNTRIYQDGARLYIEKKGAGDTVYLGDLYNQSFLNNGKRLVMMIGKDNKANNIYYDLNKAPHILVAGTTGSGKTIALHTMLLSLLINHWHDVDFVGIDAKGTELKDYSYLKNFTFVKTPIDAIQTLKKMCDEMDTRYRTLENARCRDIEAYTTNGGEMRRIICVIDELADLMLASDSMVEQYIVRLAQKARACGIHLIIATQSPRADVLTGLIKCNIPTRMALSVTNNTESRIILDQKGADKLNGKGDMLFLPSGRTKPIRIQGCYMTDKERQNIIALALARQDKNFAKKIGLF